MSASAHKPTLRLCADLCTFDTSRGSWCVRTPCPRSPTLRRHGTARKRSDAVSTRLLDDAVSRRLLDVIRACEIQLITMNTQWYV